MPPVGVVGALRVAGAGGASVFLAVSARAARGSLRATWGEAKTPSSTPVSDRGRY
jgi:hypothetical protein